MVVGLEGRFASLAAVAVPRKFVVRASTPKYCLWKCVVVAVVALRTCVVVSVVAESLKCEGRRAEVVVLTPKCEVLVVVATLIHETEDVLPLSMYGQRVEVVVATCVGPTWEVVGVTSVSVQVESG